MTGSMTGQSVQPEVFNEPNNGNCFSAAHTEMSETLQVCMKVQMCAYSYLCVLYSEKSVGFTLKRFSLRNC